MNEIIIKIFRDKLNSIFPEKIVNDSGIHYKVARFSNDGFSAKLLSDYREMVNIKLHEIKAFNGCPPKSFVEPFKERYGTHIFLLHPLIDSASKGGALFFHNKSVLNFAYIHESTLVWSNAVNHKKENLIHSYTFKYDYQGQNYLGHDSVDSNTLVLTKFMISELILRIEDMNGDNTIAYPFEEIYELILLDKDLIELCYPKKYLKILNQIFSKIQKMLFLIS